MSVVVLLLLAEVTCDPGTVTIGSHLNAVTAQFIVGHVSQLQVPQVLVFLFGFQIT